jgi:hypothetical protein
MSNALSGEWVAEVNEVDTRFQTKEQLAAGAFTDWGTALSERHG